MRFLAVGSFVGEVTGLASFMRQPARWRPDTCWRVEWCKSLHFPHWCEAQPSL